MLKLGVSVFEADDLARTALHRAAMELRTDSSALIMAHGGGSMVADIYNVRAYDAVRMRHRQMIRVTAPFNVDAELSKKPLKAALETSEWLKAAKDGWTEGIKMRMYDEENPQDVNEAAEGGVNALMLATSTNSLSTVEALIALNADVNAATTDCKTTALMVACMSDYSDVAEALISANADVNAVDKESFSPLMLAAAMGADRTISLLLRSDPPANQKWVQYDKSAKVGQNQSGRTALHWASAMGFLEACRLFVADPPTNEEGSYTPMEGEEEGGDSLSSRGESRPYGRRRTPIRGLPSRGRQGLPPAR